VVHVSVTGHQIEPAAAVLLWACSCLASGLWSQHGYHMGAWSAPCYMGTRVQHWHDPPHVYVYTLVCINHHSNLWLLACTHLCLTHAPWTQVVRVAGVVAVPQGCPAPVPTIQVRPGRVIRGATEPPVEGESP
jgi:hypothetical protein